MAEHRIITRAEWGARHGRGKETDGAKTRMIAHHDGNDRSRENATLEEDIELMRFLEHYHVNERPERLVGIGYTDVVMQSGRIFEGRGWGRVGGHTRGLNSSAYAACFPINGNRTRPSARAIAAFHWLRAEGVRLGHLTANHIVSGHRDHGTVDCPGDLLYDSIVRGTPMPVEVPTVRQTIEAHSTLRLGKGGIHARPTEQQAVKALQRRLADMQELERRHVTGYFGDLTDAAVRRVQKKYRLTPDGIVGPKTYQVLAL